MRVKSGLTIIRPTGPDHFSPNHRVAMARNEKWIRKKMKQGCEIIDIGIDPSRATRSPFYEMEKRNLGNANYPTTPSFWPPGIP